MLASMRVGLTGGIGSGKSEVARRLRAHGAVVVDYDQLARDVVGAGTPGQAAVVAEFGPEVLAADGELDRERLAQLVFGDEDARGRLNAIVHPLVRARAAEAAAQVPDGGVVVHDIPLLVESGLAPAFDTVVVVTAPVETRVRRLVTRRGMSEEAALARVRAQASDEDRLAAATHVVSNDGDLEALDAQVERVWEEIQRYVADR